MPNIHPFLSPEERRVLFNKTKVFDTSTYQKCEALFKTFKFGDKLWISDQLLTLGLCSFKVIGSYAITIPAINDKVIAAIGPVATQITLDHSSIEGSFTKDVISYNIFDAFLYVTNKKPH